GDEWLRVADATWREPRKAAVERVVDLERGQRQVDREGAPRVGWRPGRGDRAELLHELRPALGRDLDPGGAGVAAVAEEQRRALLERGAQIQRAIAPARRPDDRSQLRTDDRRPPEVVDEPR